MKKLLFMLFLISSVAVAQNKGPVLSLSAQKLSFDPITQGEKVSFDVELKNDGDEELVITKVRASCGCTAAKPAEDKLAPGKSTNLHIVFNSAGKRGNQRKYVYIFTNDKNNPEMRILITGKVEVKQPVNSPQLRLEKNQFHFGEVKEGTIVDAELVFKNVGTAPLQIYDVKTSCGCTAAILSSKHLEIGESGKLRIELDTTGFSGLLTRTVTIISNDSKNSQQTITIFADIKK